MRLLRGLLMLLYSFLETMNHWDQQIFLLINESWSASFLDSFLPFWREKRNWIPLYFIMLVIAIIKLKKHAWWWIVLFIATVSLADIVSSHLMKPLFERIRPCQAGSGIETLMNLRLPNCPSNRSFPSSHAANHFAMAFFIFFSQAPKMYWSRWLFILWATIICWAQIYVGVHYPGDILGGAIIGLILGLALGKIYLKYNTKIKKYFQK